MVIPAALSGMEWQLSAVCSDMKDLKKDKQEVAQPHTFANSGMAQSTPAESFMIMPVNSSGIVSDEVIADHMGEEDGSRGRVHRGTRQQHRWMI